MFQSWSQRLSRPQLVLGVLLAPLLASGCYVDRSGLGIGPYESFDVAPSLVCAGETVHLSWRVNTPAGCAGGGPRCSSVRSIASSDPSISIGSTSNPGEADVTVTGDTDFTATFTLCQTSEDGVVCTLPYPEYTKVTVIDGAGPFALDFRGTCNGWLPVDVSGISACLQMQQICAARPLHGGEVITVTAFDGDRNALGPPIRLTSAERCFSADSLLGAKLLTASNNGFSTPSRDCSVLSGPNLPDQRLTLDLICDPIATGCTLGAGGGAEPASRPTSASLLSGQDQVTPSVTSDTISICDLKTSCGNQVCDSGCEDAKSCPADCASVTAPPGQKPVVTQNVPAPTDEPTEVVTPDVTEPPKICEPGWVPVDACVCCGSNKVCPDHVEVNHPDCSQPGGNNTGGNNNGNEKKPVCGDGVCDASEKGCGVCSTDCGPC